MKFITRNSNTSWLWQQLSSSKDANIILIVITCVITGQAFQYLNNRYSRAILSSLLSIWCIFIASHFHVYLSLIVIFYAIMQCLLITCLQNIKYFRIISIPLLFICISALRFSLDQQLNSQLTLVLMMQLLKVTSAVFDMTNLPKNMPDLHNEPRTRKKRLSQDRTIISHEKVPQSFLDLLFYVFCHCGLVLGPYFRYQVFHDWLSADLQWQTDKGLRRQSVFIALQKITSFPILLVLMLANQQLSPLDILKHGQASASKLLFNAFLLFYFYRARLYLGLRLGELICISCSLGAYSRDCQARPAHGPQVFKINDYSSSGGDVKKTKNLNCTNQIIFDYSSVCTCESIMNVEWNDSIRSSLRCWNLPIQYWLARHVYQPLRYYLPFTRVMSTMFVSALWHGIYTGYFVSFCTLPFLMWVEQPWKTYLHKVHQRSLPVFTLFWFLRVCLIAYFAVPFYLLHWTSFIHFYQAVHWCGHWLLVIMLLYTIALNL